MPDRPLKSSMKSDTAHLRKKSTFDRGSQRIKNVCNYNHVTTISPQATGFNRDNTQVIPEKRQESKQSFPHLSHHDSRRGSILSSLKKMFKHGKIESESLPPSPKRTKHEHAISEPCAFPVPGTETPSQHEQYTCPMPQRSISATTNARPGPSPLHISNSSSSGIPFPRSARLKPLNLGTPTIAPPAILSRRQSHPEGMTVHSTGSRDPGPVSPIPEQSPHSNRMKRLVELEREERPRASLKAFRRRSRSEGNLKKKAAAVSDNKQDEDIHGWRENVQSIVWHASELRNAGSRHGSLQPGPTDNSPAEDSAVSGDVGPHPQSQDENEDKSFSVFGKDMSKDLEDRVAKLEAGVQDFQEALRYLTNNDLTRTDTSSSHNLNRVPSILVNSLHHIEIPRPSTSEGTTLLAEGRTRTPTPHSMSSRLEKRPRSASGEKRAHVDTVSSIAFMNLYDMVEDERAARLRLEHQLQDLQQDLAELKCHVTIKPTLGGYTTVEGRRCWASERFSKSHGDLASRASSSESSRYPRSIHDDEHEMRNDWPFDNDDEIF